MSAHTVPRSEWESFLESFGRAHEGWLSSLEVARPGETAAVVAFEMPLVDVKLERSSAHADDVIAIGLRAPDGARVTHVMRKPIAVALDVAASGADAGMHIRSAADTMRLRFRVAAAPESLDGVAPGSP
jgi:uncharacterized protein DUF5335